VFWSAGSAAGEEAYSLAIIAWEWLAARSLERRWRRLRIIGTDIDGDAITAARAARYPPIALTETPPEIRRRWFAPEGDSFTLRPPIGGSVEFRQLDVLHGRPDFEADLIVCRNLLIYLDRPAQERVFATIGEVLRPGGYLVLGRVETLPAECRGAYEVLNGRERVYRKR
jgi:chemotaxis methyl-accepting protein methylase